MKLIETAGDPDIAVDGRWSDDPWSEGLRRDLKQAFVVGAVGTLLSVSSGAPPQAVVLSEVDAELVVTVRDPGAHVLKGSAQAVAVVPAVPDPSQGQDVDEWAPRVERGKTVRVVARRSDRTLEPDWDL